MRVRLALWLATVVLGLCCTTAQAADYVCRRPNNDTVHVRANAGGAPDCRPGGVATPVPTATPAPSPTIAMDCSDSATFGSLNYDTKSGELSLLRRVYEPGRVYHLCGTIPSNAPPKTFLGLSSVNGSNGTCNLYSVWLTAPGGMTSSAVDVSQPGTNGSFARGTWGVAVWLDPAKNPCASNPGFSMTVRPF